MDYERGFNFRWYENITKPASSGNVVAAVADYIILIITRLYTCRVKCRAPGEKAVISRIIFQFSIIDRTPLFVVNFTPF